MPQIEINIDTAGNAQVEAIGVQGAGCQQLTAAIEQAIGETSADVKKPEFQQGAACAIRNQQEAGQ